MKLNSNLTKFLWLLLFALMGITAGIVYERFFSTNGKEIKAQVMSSRLTEVNEIFLNLERQPASLKASQLRYNHDMLFLVDCSNLLEALPSDSIEGAKLRLAANESWKILKANGVEKSDLKGCSNSLQKTLGN